MLNAVSCCRQKKFQLNKFLIKNEITTRRLMKNETKSAKLMTATPDTQFLIYCRFWEGVRKDYSFTPCPDTTNEQIHSNEGAFVLSFILFQEGKLHYESTKRCAAHWQVSPPLPAMVDGAWLQKFIKNISMLHQCKHYSYSGVSCKLQTCQQMYSY